MDYYVVPTLVDEKPESIILQIGSNDITKTNYDVNADDNKDLAQRIVNIAKKCRSLGVNNIAISSILMRRGVSINKKIKKVNEEISSMCAANGFRFICNDMVDVSMIWKDGLHLTNDSTRVLANNFLKYLKGFRGNIDFNITSKKNCNGLTNEQGQTTGYRCRY